MRILFNSFFPKKITINSFILIFLIIILTGIFADSFFVLAIFPFQISLILTSSFISMTKKNLFKEFLISSPYGKNSIINSLYKLNFLINIIVIIIYSIVFFFRLKFQGNIIIENIEFKNYILLLPILSGLLINNTMCILSLFIKNQNFQSAVNALSIFLIIAFINNFINLNIKIFILLIISILIYIIGYFISKNLKEIY